MTINELFGVGNDLNALQMSLRALVFFFITLLYIRIAGMRSFGKKSSIDMIIVIVLGSVLARGIAGASGFWPTLASSGVLVIIHRLIAWLTVKNRWMETVIKGRKLLLFENEVFFKRNMLQAGISKHDLLESFRLSCPDKTIENVHAAYMETNGEISFILKDAK